MLEKHNILGVHITDRLEHASEIQNVLTEYGNCIRTRLGLHDVGGQFSSPNGVLILEFVGAEELLSKMVSALSTITGIEVQTMSFDHP